MSSLKKKLKSPFTAIKRLKKKKQAFLCRTCGTEHNGKYKSFFKSGMFLLIKCPDCLQSQVYGLVQGNNDIFEGITGETH